jgi:hypothetical protein
MAHKMSRGCHFHGTGCEKFGHFPPPHLSLQQFFSYTYQERLRVMARRRLDNLSWCKPGKGANSIPTIVGTDKSDNKLYSIQYNSSSDLSGELFYFNKLPAITQLPGK